MASGLFGLACLSGWGVYGIWQLHHAWERLVTFALGASAAYCVAVVMVVLRRHFAPEDGQVGSTHGVARPIWIEIFEKIGAPARHLANWLSPRVSLPSGSALILASVLLVTSMNVGCHDNSSFRGYEVFEGKGAWLTAENMDHNASRSSTSRNGRVGRRMGKTTREASTPAWAASTSSRNVPAKAGHRFFARAAGASDSAG